MKLYDQFKTSQKLEQEGILVDYGSFRVRVARAGGSNKKFQKIAQAKLKPYRRALQTETLDDDRSNQIVREIYSEAVVLGWETKVDNKWKSGIEGPDGSILPFNKDNVLATFNALPDLFMDIQEQAQKAALYREEGLEDDAKN